MDNITKFVHLYVSFCDYSTDCDTSATESTLERAEKHKKKPVYSALHRIVYEYKYFINRVVEEEDRRSGRSITRPG